MPHRGETPTAQPARPHSYEDAGGGGREIRAARWARAEWRQPLRSREATETDLPTTFPTVGITPRNTRHPAPGCAAPEKRPGEDPALTLKAGSLPSSARCSSRTSSMAFSQNMVPAPGPLDHRLSSKEPPHCSYGFLLLLFPGARSADPASARLGAKMATNRSALPASGLRWRPGDLPPRCSRSAARSLAVGRLRASVGQPHLTVQASVKLRLSGRTALHAAQLRMGARPIVRWIQSFSFWLTVCVP